MSSFELCPVYSIYIHISEIFNIDMAEPGSYQIRIVPKSSDYISSVSIQCVESTIHPRPYDRHSSYVREGQGVSRTVRWTMNDTRLNLGDAFLLRTEVSPTVELGKTVTAMFDVELCFVKPGMPLVHESFVVENRKLVEIELGPSKVLLSARQVVFGYQMFAYCSLEVTASLISILPSRVRTKRQPNPIDLLELNQQLRSTVQVAIESYRGLFERNAHLMKEPFEWPSDLESIPPQEEFTNGLSSELLLPKLEKGVLDLSTRLNALFMELIRTVGSSPAVVRLLYAEFAEWRHRHLGEAFYVSEHELADLRKESLSKRTERMSNFIHSSSYLDLIPKFPIHVQGNDSPGNTSPVVIFEASFGIATPTNQPERLVRAGRSNEDKEKEKRGQKDTMPSAVKRLVRSSQPARSETASNVDVDDLVEFLKERRRVSVRLEEQFGFEGILYSELAHTWYRPTILRPSIWDSSYQIRRRPLKHLLVLVHGLYGLPDDLIPYQNAILLAAPDVQLVVLSSLTNKEATWGDIEKMAEALRDELREAWQALWDIEHISFISHSMGGVIVRAAIGHPDADWLRPYLHTLLTFGSPHLGLNGLTKRVSVATKIAAWWKGSTSLKQLQLADVPRCEDSFMLRLSKNGAFGRFRNVLLVSSPYDLYVPHHSALLEPSARTTAVPSEGDRVYSEMLNNVMDDLLGSPASGGAAARTVVRYICFHPDAKTITGREAHMASLEDSFFFEKFISRSALRFFRSPQ